MEIAFTLGLMAFMVWVGIMAMGMGTESVPGDTFRAGGFPLLMVGVGLVLAALILVKELKAAKDKKAGAHEKLIDLGSPAGRAILYTAGVLVLYLAAMNIVGYVLSTLVFTAVAVFVMGYRKWGKTALFAVISTAALFLLFGKAFFVPLPRGLGILKELSYLLY